MGALLVSDQSGPLTVATGENGGRAVPVATPSSAQQMSEPLVSFPTARLDRLKTFLRAGEHKRLRQQQSLCLLPEIDPAFSWQQRVAYAFCRVLEAEQPVILTDERIAFTRTTVQLPVLYDDENWQALTAGRVLHELGPISNICANWGNVLANGLLARRQRATRSLGLSIDPDRKSVV